MTATKNAFWKKVTGWILGYHWWIIGSFVAFYLIMEYIEHGALQILNIFFLAESFFYTLSMIAIGCLTELLFRAMKTQSGTMKILESKRRLNLDVMRTHDWGELSFQLAKAPAEIAPVAESCLFISNFAANRLEPAVRWNQNGLVTGRTRLEEACLQCRLEKTSQELIFKACQTESVGEGTAFSQGESYCLPIKNGGSLLALIRFQMKSGEKLTKDQKIVFENIGDDMALAFKAGQDRKALSEILITEASLDERKKVSHFLHDNLGQNMAFLRLKLGQLLAEKDHISMDTVQSDLILMRDVADDSYEIVRGTLETMVPQTTPHLTNLLHEFAQKVSHRAHFDLTYQVNGKPFEILPDIQREVFYVFREVLSNIERHSKANHVDVSITWDVRDLQIDIRDNGIGFVPQSVDPDKHFGYRIIQERIAGVKGSVALTTEINSGTRIEILVPGNIN